MKLKFTALLLLLLLSGNASACMELALNSSTLKAANLVFHGTVIGTKPRKALNSDDENPRSLLIRVDKKLKGTSHPQYLIPTRECNVAHFGVGSRVTVFYYLGTFWVSVRQDNPTSGRANNSFKPTPLRGAA